MWQCFRRVLRAPWDTPKYGDQSNLLTKDRVRMSTLPLRTRARSLLREFLQNSASGGLVLLGAAALALIVANSPFAHHYFEGLHANFGGLSMLHWINDGMMAVYFLMVGLEIKREVMDGQLSTWPRRVLPGFAALGGMIVPALVYLAFNTSRAPQGLGHSRRYGHRVRTGCPRLARLPGADEPAYLSHGPCHHRRSRCGRHHRAILY